MEKIEDRPKRLATMLSTVTAPVIGAKPTSVGALLGDTPLGDRGALGAAPVFAAAEPLS
ncbi:hypothetical protein SAMN04489835_0736 [Mycolicibacterium rutilum]|uniref:Uncharacterized protein n=1 Tax=Mycolicibacterium rutilum TaxID=370526 RepID=A0A1H6ITK6_MYCRU|nr:hypothetical protein SAMN04489835_0736 [Mycolicibacterium rutilum]